MIKAVFDLITGLAWPAVLVWALWFFRAEIKTSILRGFDFEGVGVKMKTVAQEVHLALENTKAATRPEAIAQVKTLVQAHAKSTSAASFNFDFVESLNLLIELATTDPRTAVIRSWKLLAKAVLRAAKVSGENIEPNPEEISAALKQLESSIELPDGLVRSIRNLQGIAKKIQSEFAYVPSPDEAQQFVLYTAAARKELGETVN